MERFIRFFDKRGYTMRRMVLLTAAAALLIGLSGKGTHADVNIGATIGDHGVRGFYLAAGDYFRVEPREVMVISRRSIRDIEVPVALFIAREARVSPEMVVGLRTAGRSWMEITLHFGLRPDIYYMPGLEWRDRPYPGHYGGYKYGRHGSWRRAMLDDDEVIVLVNMRFMSEHYGYPAYEIARMHRGGRNFIVIHDDISRDQGYRRHVYERHDDWRNDRHGERNDRHGERRHRRGHWDD